MLVLLPPSEGKTQARSGAPVDLGQLSHPGLNAARVAVAGSLSAASARDDALVTLGVGASLAHEVERNLSLFEAPAAPAARVYTGVLYDAAGMATWDAATRERTRDRIRIVSALWGALSPADRIPAYRLSMDTTLGQVGRLAAYWKPLLDEELSALADGRVVVDCRSAAYAAAWTPPRGTRWLAVRVEREAAGKRTVVSHMAKHTRGLLAARLARSRASFSDADAVAHTALGLAAHGVTSVELGPAVTRGARSLTLVVADAAGAA